MSALIWRARMHAGTLRLCRKGFGPTTTLESRRSGKSVWKLIAWRDGEIMDQAVYPISQGLDPYTFKAMHEEMRHKAGMAR